MKEKLAKARNVYQENGPLYLIERIYAFIVWRFIRAFRIIKMKISTTNPWIPPVGLLIGNRRVEVGYNSKYIFNDGRYKIMPNSNDIVMEAGVYKGEDTASLAKFSSHVIGFEPSPRNYKKAKKNLESFSNVELLNAGLWNSKDELEVSLGQEDYDDGFLEPDENSGEIGQSVPVDTVENYVKELDIDTVDFLKIEAEGAEPEIIDGLGDIRPQNIAVNIDAERSSEPVGGEVMKRLQPLGYELVGIKWGHILFFTKDDVERSAFSSEFL